MTDSLKEVLNSKQYKTKNTNTVYSKQYGKILSREQVRDFIESLDNRVYCNPKFLPFYCKAARLLGFRRLIELQAMVINDPRINSPELFNAEKVYWSLLKSELNIKQKETN